MNDERWLSVGVIRGVLIVLVVALAFAGIAIGIARGDSGSIILSGSARLTIRPDNGLANAIASTVGNSIPIRLYFETESGEFQVVGFISGAELSSDDEFTTMEIVFGTTSVPATPTPRVVHPHPVLPTMEPYPMPVGPTPTSMVYPMMAIR